MIIKPSTTLFFSQQNNVGGATKIPYLSAAKPPPYLSLSMHYAVLYLVFYLPKPPYPVFYLPKPPYPVFYLPKPTYVVVYLPKPPYAVLYLPNHPYVVF